jgi:nickel superoxide dismutase
MALSNYNYTTGNQIMTFQKTFCICNLLLILALPQALYAHCQVPCGIYDDHARVQAMLEDVVTIDKAVKEMNALADKKDVQSQNQMTRWVMNKESHAQKIISTMADYFLTQRVKPGQKDYAERLAKHHAVILAAMKAKQNSDAATVKSLEKAVQALAPYYPEHKH